MMGALKSKTVWFNVAVALLGYLEVNQALVSQWVGPQNLGHAMMAIALGGIILRTVTTSALSDK